MKLRRGGTVGESNSDACLLGKAKEGRTEVRHSTFRKSERGVAHNYMDFNETPWHSLLQ
jgi:hypothetical protein